MNDAGTKSHLRVRQIVRLVKDLVGEGNRGVEMDYHHWKDDPVFRVLEARRWWPTLGVGGWRIGN